MHRAKASASAASKDRRASGSSTGTKPAEHMDKSPALSAEASRSSSVTELLEHPPPVQGVASGLATVPTATEAEGLLHQDQQPAAACCGADLGPVPQASCVSLPEIVDVDVAELEDVLDECHRRVKHDIVGLMVALKARAKSQHAAALDQERLKACDALKAKQEEVELLKKDLATETRHCKSLTIIATRLADALGGAKASVRATKHAVQLWYAWRAWTKRQLQLKKNMQRALSWYFSEYMLRRTFTTWRKWALTEHRHTIARKHQQKIEAVRAEVQAQCEDTISSLRWQLAQANEALGKEYEVRCQLEEDMKQAFMRGVCALNIEAMAVMKRGMPPSGINPFAGSESTVTDDTSSEPDSHGPTSGPAGVGTRCPPLHHPQTRGSPESAGASGGMLFSQHSNILQYHPAMTAAQHPAYQPRAASPAPQQPHYELPADGTQEMAAPLTQSPAAVVAGSGPGALTPSVQRASPGIARGACGSPGNAVAAAGYKKQGVVVQRGPATEAPRPRALHPAAIPAARR